MVTALLSLKSFTNTGVAGTEVQQKAKIFFSCFIVRFLPTGLLLSVSNLVTCVLTTFSPTYWSVKSTLNATFSKNKCLWCLQYGGCCGFLGSSLLRLLHEAGFSCESLGSPGGVGAWVSLAHFSRRPRGWKLGAAPDMSTGRRRKVSWSSGSWISMTCHHFLQILLFWAGQNTSLDSTGNLWPLNDYHITLISGLVEAMGANYSFYFESFQLS